MKILHILDHSVPLHSGYTFRSQSIFQSQQKRGWKPVVVTSPKHEQNWKGSRTDHELINGFLYYRTGEVSTSRVPVVSELRLMNVLTRRIDGVVAFEKPDIIHAHSPVLTALPALRVGRKRQVPVVYEIRAFWEDAAVDHGTYKEHSLEYKLVHHAETYVCRHAQQITVLCRGLRNDLIGRGIAEDKLTIVYNGINADDFRPRDPDREYGNSWKLHGKKVIGFIGSFYRYEGIDLLIEAFSRLCKTREDLVLLLVGGGETAQELRDQIDRLDISDKVRMPGRIPHEHIPGVYALVDVLAYPRRSMRLTDLVTPLKPLEAMAMGKVLVASDVGGRGELIEHKKTGILFPAGDVDGLAKALMLVLDNQDISDRISRYAPQWVREHHSWDRTTAVYEDVYAKALRGIGLSK